MPFHPATLALITGAASGIGLAFAKHCHSQGLHVALVDRNSAALEAAIRDIPAGTSPGEAKVKGYAVDVSDQTSWKKLLSDVTRDFPGEKVRFLMLNAGISMPTSFGSADSTEEEDMAEKFATIMQTNYLGVVNGITTFLPSLRSKTTSASAREGDEESHVLITGSKQGMTNPPGNPAYNASKAAVRSLAESLSYELRDTAVHVSLLVPGWTWTGLTNTKNKSEKPEGAWTPEQVVEYAVKKMELNQFYIICPDGDVTEDMDKRRVEWTAGDVVERRPPMSRWREEWKGKAEEWMRERGV